MEDRASSLHGASGWRPTPRAYPAVALIVLFATIYLGLAIVIPNEATGRLAIDYFWVAFLGLAVGATELLARYSDRPWDAVTSGAGFTYMAINAGAACLALFLMIAWNIQADDPPTRVLTAGIAAMALFRSGLFTTRIGQNELPVGPNLILKVLLDVLDRAYDRERAFQRADLVRTVMGGVDYEKAKSALSKFCFSLMQNVSTEERDRFDAEVERLEKEITDPEVRSLAVGLRLINIVGETTLDEASRVLGSTIVAFRWLDEDLLVDAGAPTYQDLRANLYLLCNGLTHPRRRASEAQVREALAQVDALAALNNRARGLVLVHNALRQYGRETVQRALVLLAPPVGVAPPAAPPSPPAQAPSIPANGP